MTRRSKPATKLYKESKPTKKEAKILNKMSAILEKARKRSSKPRKGESVWWTMQHNKTLCLHWIERTEKSVIATFLNGDYGHQINAEKAMQVNHPEFKPVRIIVRLA